LRHRASGSARFVRHRETPPAGHDASARRRSGITTSRGANSERRVIANRGDSLSGTDRVGRPSQPRLQIFLVLACWPCCWPCCEPNSFFFRSLSVSERFGQSQEKLGFAHLIRRISAAAAAICALVGR